MKKFSLICLTIIVVISCGKHDSVIQNCNFVNFYHYKDTIITVGELQNNYVFVACDTSYSDGEIRDFVANLPYFDLNYDFKIWKDVYKFMPLKFNKPKSCEEITAIILELKRKDWVLHANYTMQSEYCTDLWGDPMGSLCVYACSDFFYVKIADENDLTDLKNTIAETQTEFIKRDPYMPQWCILRANKNSKGDGMVMTNYFYETGLFENAEPDIMHIPVE